MHRIYYQGTLKIGSEIPLSSHSHQHLCKVLRLKSGASFILFNGSGIDYNATLIGVSRNKSHAIIHSAIPYKETSSVQFNIACAIIKPQAMDFLIQKATELGVHFITPLLTEYCTVKQNKTVLEKKYQHWQAICIGASEQCGRSILPKILPVQKLDDWLKEKQGETNVLLYQDGQQRLQKITVNQHINLISGPEGGFSNTELALFQQYKIPRVKLGQYILRAETAPLVALAICQDLFLKQTL